MGLLKGTLTFSQYRITGDLPEHFNDFFDNRIKKNAFQNVFASMMEEKTMGWTGIENIIDTDFQHARHTWGKYLLFSLRIDRKVIPPSLLRIRCMEAERDYLARQEMKKIRRLQREEIRERVRRDLLSSASPVPSFFEASWSPTDGKLLLCSLSEKIMDDFAEHFKQSFDLAISPFTPWEPRFTKAITPEQITELDPLVVGRDFLTWLWFKSEERNGSILIPGKGDVAVEFVRRIVLESGEGEYSETVVCQGLHAGLGEGKEALRRGKKIKEARIKLGRDINQWEFTFKADRFQFQSLKLPVMPDAEDNEQDRDGLILERIYLLEEAITTMEELFDAFIKIRLSPRWESEESTNLKRWLDRAE
jgi:recombination associated protein RdgC